MTTTVPVGTITAPLPHICHTPDLNTARNFRLCIFFESTFDRLRGHYWSQPLMRIAACSRLNPGEMRNFIQRVLGWQRGSAGPFFLLKGSRSVWPWLETPGESWADHMEFDDGLTEYKEGPMPVLASLCRG